MIGGDVLFLYTKICRIMTHPFQNTYFQSIFACNASAVTPNKKVQLTHRSSRYDHITPILRDLHWLKRVADTNRRRLRSSSSSLLAVRRTRLSTVGDRAFPVIGSRFWNTLPVSVTFAPSLAVFRSRLKSYLFERSFRADSY